MTLKGWGLEILLGGILTIKHFCYAEGDTWHRLIKINMTYVHMKPEVKKKWSNSSYCSYKWSLYWVITWRLQLRVEGMTLFIGEDVNLVIEILLVRRLRKIFAWWAELSPITRSSSNRSGGIDSQHPIDKPILKTGEIILVRGEYRSKFLEIIRLDTVLYWIKGFNSNEFFQIVHCYATENAC